MGGRAPVGLARVLTGRPHTCSGALCIPHAAAHKRILLLGLAQRKEHEATQRCAGALRDAL